MRQRHHAQHDRRSRRGSHRTAELDLVAKARDALARVRLKLKKPCPTRGIVTKIASVIANSGNDSSAVPTRNCGADHAPAREHAHIAVRALGSASLCDG